MTAFKLYLLLKLDVVSGLFLKMAIILIGFILVSLVVWAMSYSWLTEEQIAACRHFLLVNMRWAIPSAFICILVSCFLPSTKDAAIIYVVPRVVNNVQVQAIPGKMLALANEWLDKLHPETIEKARGQCNSKS